MRIMRAVDRYMPFMALHAQRVLLTAGKSHLTGQRQRGFYVGARMTARMAQAAALRHQRVIKYLSMFAGQLARNEALFSRRQSHGQQEQTAGDHREIYTQ